MIGSITDKRKIIQITAAQSDNSDNDLTYSLYALCDDGTVWDYQWDGSNSRWVLMAKIPQEDGT
jgi:hypothetical protein